MLVIIEHTFYYRPVYAMDRLDTRLEETIAPPRKNGELIFDAPWESRAFGMAMVLHQQSTFPWSEFSDCLATEIATGDGAPHGERVLPVPPDTTTCYYQRWLSSLEKLLIEKGIVSAGELEVRTAEFAAGLWDEEH